MKLLYFTTTGNSLWVARRFGADLHSMVGRDVTAREISDDEAIGVVSPVYFGDLPGPVSEFLGCHVIEAPYLFAVLTCGTTPGLATRRLMELGGFDYVRSIRMVDNYFPMFDVGKQVRNIEKKRVPDKMDMIVREIAGRRRWIETPSLAGRVATWWMRMFPLPADAYRRFRIHHDGCTQCGICAQVCPIANISYSPWPVIGERCLTCGACRHNCPQGAISYTGEKSTYRYRHPDVLLADIIASNNQI